MYEDFASIARKSAIKLASTVHRSLPDSTEKVLAERTESERIAEFDPNVTISLASLLVAISSFAWVIYSELKTKDSNAPNRDILIKRIRTKFSNYRNASRDKVEKIIDVVVEEIWIHEGLSE